MEIEAQLSFSIEPLDAAEPEVLTIVPVLNGTSLIQLIGKFEREHGFEPAGGYAGIIPDQYRFGPLDTYFLKESSQDERLKNGHFILGCNCGELGCWPLSVKISKRGESIVWDQFCQPYRSNWD